jgi:hypothetical protein
MSPSPHSLGMAIASHCLAEFLAKGRKVMKSFFRSLVVAALVAHSSLAALAQYGVVDSGRVPSAGAAAAAGGFGPTNTRPHINQNSPGRAGNLPAAGASSNNANSAFQQGTNPFSSSVFLNTLPAGIFNPNLAIPTAQNEMIYQNGQLSYPPPDGYWNYYRGNPPVIDSPSAASIPEAPTLGVTPIGNGIAPAPPAVAPVYTYEVPTYYSPWR